MYKASVLMPAYNDARYIRDAIDSILTQTFKNFELIIVNDGSTDDTLQILSQFNDERIKVFSFEQNQGRPAARNYALKMARGEYACWMDADDISLPRRLETQIAFMDTHPNVVVCGGHMQCFHQSEIIWCAPQGHEKIKAGLFFTPTIANPTACIRLSAIKRLNIKYNTSLLRAQDYGFWCDVIIDHNCQARNINKILCLYRYKKNISTSSYHKQVLKQNLQRLHLEPNEVLLDKYMNLSLAYNLQQFSFKDYVDFIDLVLSKNKSLNIFHKKEFLGLLCGRLIDVSKGFALSPTKRLLLFLTSMDIHLFWPTFKMFFSRKMQGYLHKLKAAVK